MPTIQLYQHQSQLHNQARPRANPNVFGAAQAQALGQVSEQLGQLGQKLQDTADHRALTQHHLDEEQFQANWQNFLSTPKAKQMEENDLIAQYEKQRKTFNDTQLANKHLSRRAREEIQTRTQLNTLRGTQQVTQHARQQGIARAKAASDSAIQLAISRADHAAALRQYDDDIALGLRYPETREAFSQATLAQIQNNEAMRLINTDPAQALDRLTARDEDGKASDFTAIEDEARRYTLINHAERATAQLSAQTYNDILDRMQGGETIGDREIDELLEQRRISSQHARSLKKSQKGSFDPTAYAKLHEAILAYNPASKDATLQHAALLGAIISSPPEERQELRALLAEKQKGNSSPLNSAAHKAELAQINHDFNKGFYGNFYVPALDEKGRVKRKEGGRIEYVEDKKLRDAARENKLKVEQALTEWILKNPNATALEISRFVKTYQTEQAISTATSSLLSAIQKDLEADDEED